MTPDPFDLAQLAAQAASAPARGVGNMVSLARPDGTSQQYPADVAIVVLLADHGKLLEQILAALRGIADLTP